MRRKPCILRCQYPVEHRAWINMLQRCYNPKAQAYHNYGARGVKVCPAWYYTFDAFIADMGPRPGPEFSLDRREGGDYTPLNCRWATAVDQARNRRTNVMLTHNNETLCATEWAIRLGASRSTVLKRLAYGWDVARAVTEPV